MKRAHTLVVLVLTFTLAVGATTSHAEVTRIEILSRTLVEEGTSFGVVGPYEQIMARVYYAVAPENVHNQAIVDLARAPRNERGLVEFFADLHLLRPRDPGRGNGTLLLDIPNRGRARIVQRLHRSTAPRGETLLMRLGFTIAWVGWQFDIEEGIRLEAPVATLGDSDITGVVRTTIVPTAPQYSAPLPARYAAVDLESEAHIMTVRDAIMDTPTRLPRSAWRFGRLEGGRVVEDPTQVYLEKGFEAHKIYEVLYRSSNPPVAGLGFAAVRDLVSFAKNTPNNLFSVRAASGFLRAAGSYSTFSIRGLMPTSRAARSSTD